MSASNPQSATPKGAPLTPEQRREGERNWARLLIIAHDKGVPVAMEEWRRIVAEKRAKAQNSLAEPVGNPVSSTPVKKSA